MSLPTCTECGIRKAGQHFTKNPDGTSTGVCKKCSGGGSAVTTEKPVRPKRAPKVEPPPVEDSLRVTLAPGYGVDAFVEEECLKLVQGEDSIVLSRTEAKVLFAGFSEWVG